MFGLLSVGASVLTMIAQTRGGAVSSLEQVPVSTRLATAFDSLFRYLIKLAWPTKMSVLYPLEPTWPAWEIVTSMLLVGIVLFFALKLRKTKPYWLVGWLWFFGMLIPVIGIVQAGAQAMADRFTYLPSIGLFIVVAWGMNDLLSRWKRPQMVAGILASAVLVACGAVASRQVQYWRDGESLFLHSIDVTRDNYVMHASLGAFYLCNNRLPEARREMETSLAICPTYPVAHCMLGDVFLCLEKEEEAAEQFRAALRPNFPEPRMKLGQILTKKNQPAEAAAHFSALLEDDPSDPEAHYWLGRALALQGKIDAAASHFMATLKLWPNSADAHYQLALALSIKQQTAQAIAHYRDALRLAPNHADALNNLAWILAVHPDQKFRNGTEAVVLASRACTLTTNSQPLIVGTLAAAYAEAGKFDDAIATAQKAHDLAAKSGQPEIAARNLELQEIYRSHRAFHEEPAKAE
jgi:tetratricopeptide (TPR) repeat protein